MIIVLIWAFGYFSLTLMNEKRKTEIQIGNNNKMTRFNMGLSVF
jgi:hypothetical protein